MQPAFSTPSRSHPLLRYRAWRGQLNRSAWSAWSIARVALGMMFRRKLFWGLYGCSLLVFFFFFYGQYLQVFVQTQIRQSEAPIRLGTGPLAPKVTGEDLTRILDRSLKVNGSAATYSNFIWFEGYLVMIVLALAGSLIVGNDFHYGSLPFYLSKPISRWHYVLGKCLAVGIFLNLMTTVPALVLFGQYGLLDRFSYYWDEASLLLGIFGYGLALTVTLSLVLVATASWLRRTVPMIMVWTSIFVLGRILPRWLVDGLKLPESWRLVDLWNNLYLVGEWCFQIPLAEVRPSPQPPYWQAALVVTAICGLCLWYLHRRIQAVEIVE